MKKTLRNTILIFWLFIVLIASAIYFAPAGVVGMLISNYTSGTFNIANSKGKLYAGEGELITLLLPAKVPQIVSPLKWELVVSELYRGKIVFNLFAGKQKSTISWQGKWLFNINKLPIPLKLIDYLIPKDMLITWQDLNASGQVLINKLSGELDNFGESAKIKGELQWQNASLAVFPISPIGDYLMAFNINDKNAKIDFKTLNGPLSISGGGEGTINRISLDLVFEPSPDTKLLLTPVLSFWGQPIDDKKYKITVRDLAN